MTSTVALNDKAVIQAVRRGRNVHDEIILDSSHLYLPLQLEWLGDDLIKTLVVGNVVRLHLEGFSPWDGMKIERIEFPNAKGGIFRRDVLHPHRPQVTCLKSLRMDQQIVVENVIQMLKRHLFLKEIEFNNARFKPAKRLNFEEALKDVQKKINLLSVERCSKEDQSPVEIYRRPSRNDDYRQMLFERVSV
uniref:IF3_C domain-containing protein n=1 Tax=Panagrellus redivivus TaxID=6233 RepID=A0A7E4V3Y5_PANRE